MDTSLPKRRHPLTLDSIAILVALADGERTGMEIQSQISGDTLGVYVRNSSLYTALHRFEEVGIVTHQGKYYSLTDKGWHKLKVNTRMMKLLVEAGNRRLTARTDDNPS